MSQIKFVADVQQMYPADRQMYPWGYMYPRLRTSAIQY